MLGIASGSALAAVLACYSLASVKCQITGFTASRRGRRCHK